MKSKSGKNALVFDEKSHRYILNSEPVPGVTSILKESSPGSPQLEAWKINQSLNALVERIKSVPLPVAEWPKAFWEEAVKYAKSAWRSTAKKAADIGSIVHDYCESIEGGKTFDLSIIETHPDKEKIKTCIEKFEAWRKLNGDTIMAQEGIVASVDQGYAGKFDRLAKRGDKVVLSDFKTSGRIYPEYWVQLAAYVIAIEEWLGINVDIIEIIRIGKEDGAFEAVQISDPIDIIELREQFIRQLETYAFFKEKNRAN